MKQLLWAQKSKMLLDSKITIYITCICLVLSLLVRKGWFFFLFLILSIFSIMMCARFIISNLQHKEEYKFVLLLVVIGGIVFFPLLHRGFFYHDDYWGYLGEPFSGHISWGLGRGVQSFLCDLFNFVDVRSSFKVRWFTVFWAVILCLMFYTWIFKWSKSVKFAFISAGIICFSSVMSDCVSYLSINSFIYGVVLMFMSLIIYEDAVESYGKNKNFIIFILKLCLSGTWIFMAYQSYQFTIEVIFVCLAIKFWYCQEFTKNFIKSLFYILLNGGVFTIYYASIILLGQGNVSSRATTIENIEEVIHKITWFFCSVLPNCIYRIIAIFFGRTVFANKNYMYEMIVKEEYSTILRGLSILILSIIIVGILVLVWKQKQLWRGGALLLCLPGTYCIYLLLREDGYLTYYAFSLISLLIFMFLASLYEIVRLFRKHVIENYRIAVLAFIIILIQSNIYNDDYWVAENLKIYDYIYNTLKVENSNQRIHVYGTPVPYSNTAYSVFAVSRALEELELKTENYIITCTNNRDFVASMPVNTFDEICERVKPKDIELLNKFYFYDDSYNQYYLSDYSFANEDSMKEIRRILKEGGILPNEEDSTVIDITWIENVW